MGQRTGWSGGVCFMDVENGRQLGVRLRDNVGRVLVGKDDVVDLLFVAIVAGGHILLEDVPGTGKTLLAKTFARSFAGDCKRVQFTPDLLPGDLTGVHIFDQRENDFRFRPGPVFTNILLADEINRATPRTQSSLLEAMEERQVTVDGETRALPELFLVVATQNPVESQGTFPLPEAQLDRFLIRIDMRYPTTAEGLSILRRFEKEDPLGLVEAVATAADIQAARRASSTVAVHDDVLAYLLAIVEATRTHEEVALGVSPRGSLALLRAARVYAMLAGRDFVTPDDVKYLTRPVLAHRLVPRSFARGRERRQAAILDSILAATAVPAESRP